MRYSFRKLASPARIFPTAWHGTAGSRLDACVRQKPVANRRFTLPVFRAGCEIFALAVYLFSAAPMINRAAETPSPAAILQDLRSFREMGSVLYVAAHP